MIDAHQPPPSPIISWRRALPGIALGVAGLLLSGCSNVAQGFADGWNSKNPQKADKLTCTDLADKAVEISHDKDVKLLKVRKLKLETDNYATYKLPTGDKEALILSCTGTGVWSNGDTSPVLLKYTVDSDGQVFYSYEPL